MTTIVVGDLHGQFEIALRALSFGLPTVFLGDYMDSFKRTPQDMYDTIDIIESAINSGQAVGLLGNHEVSYLDPCMRCSGWNSTKQQVISADYKGILENKFKYYHETEGFLLSHAGVSDYLLKMLNKDLRTYLDDGDFTQIGWSRGGSKPCGGLLWCDWSEFTPVDGVKQIVGHSRGKTVREKEGNYCIDVLEDTDNWTVAFIDNGSVEFKSLI